VNYLSLPRQRGQLANREEEVPVKELMIIFGFVAIWFALQMWILPRFGINT
jgi:hypothetical protein